ncbi:MAG TPA: 30S ribosomal protein S6 [Stellaceae bacterium]|nr:30S ribosomal protein S6 [Stellaceae bacterium]
MPFYENVFIARQDISAAQVEALADTFTGIVAAQGGQVTKREYWGLRNLAYRIKKNRKGHYVLFNLDAPPPAVNELERNMRINEDVLRYITVRVDALEEGPSAVMQNRGRSEERDRDRDRDRDRGGRRGFGDRDRDRDREPATQSAGEGGEE